jgi:hypothetical protein
MERYDAVRTHVSSTRFQANVWEGRRRPSVLPVFEDTPRCSGLSSHPSSRRGSGVYVEPRTASRVPGRHSGHIPDVISLPVRNACSARAFHDLRCQTHEQVTAADVREPHASVTVHRCSRVESRGRVTSSWALSGPEGTWDDCIEEIAARRLNSDSGQSIPSYAPVRVGSAGTLCVWFRSVVQAERIRRSRFQRSWSKG